MIGGIRFAIPSNTECPLSVPFRSFAHRRDAKEERAIAELTVEVCSFGGNGEAEPSRTRNKEWLTAKK
jgi:hypothetical protein